MARIAIVGVGAIGSVVAAGLARTGRHDLLLCVRRPLPRLVVAAADGETEVRATVLTNPEEAPAADWVVVATKAYDAAGTGRWLARLAGRGAPVVIMQNGVEHRERFAPYVPTGQLIPAMVDCPAERDSPERVRQRGPMVIRVPDGAGGRGFADLVAGAGFDAGTTDDFVTTIWRKLCGNSVGIISALLLRPTEVMNDEGVAEAARDIVRECVAVGRSEGARLGDDVPEAVVRACRAAPPDSLNSLHADRLAGRPMEVDARNGAIVRIGARHGIPTPCNRLAIALLQAAVKGPGGGPGRA